MFYAAMLGKRRPFRARTHRFVAQASASMYTMYLCAGRAPRFALDAWSGYRLHIRASIEREHFELFLLGHLLPRSGFAANAVFL